MTQNVQPTQPTDQPEAPVRPTKTASQLEPGEWITAGPYAGIDGTDDAEVLFVYPYAGSKVAVTIQEATVTKPMTIHLQADEKCLLLTAEEIAKLQRAAEQRRLVDDLRAFTSIVAKGLPFPEQLHINVAVDTRAQVIALAEALGVETGPWIKTGLSVRWPADRKSYEPGFQFMAYTGEEPSDPDPTGLAYSREPESIVVAPVPAGVEGHPEGRAAVEPAARRRGPHCSECMQDVPGGYQGLVQHQVEVHGAWSDVPTS